MDNRYGLTSQGSGIWRSIRDGDFEEEQVWDVLRERKDSMKPDFEHSSVSTTRKFSPKNGARMIPKASSTTTSTRTTSGSSCNETMSLVHQQSAPINIPDWSKIYKMSKKVNKSNGCNDDDDDDEIVNGDGASEDSYDDYEDGEEESSTHRLPPHEFIARRLATSRIPSFSVFEGVGRTLKGRDLSKVRNAVLTKTGFLESL